MAHIGPVAAVKDFDLAAFHRVLAKVLENFLRYGPAPEPALAPARTFFGEQRHGAIETHREDFFGIGKISISAVMQNKGSEPAQAGRDWSPSFGMNSNRSRQR